MKRKRLFWTCRTVICMSFILSTHNFLHANTIKPLEDAIAEMVNMAIKNPKPYYNVKELVSKYDGNLVVEQAVKLINVPNEAVEKLGYLILKTVPFYHDKPEVRKQVVNVLVKSLPAKNGKATDNSEWLLEHFRSSDFSEEAKAQIKQCFKETIKHIDGIHDGRYTQNMILLVGLTDMKSEMDRLQKIVDSGKGLLWIVGTKYPPAKTAFSALKAMARMGDKKAIEKCISIVDSEKDDQLKVEHLLNHIQYIRQHEAVECMKKYLYSEKIDPFHGVDVVRVSHTRRTAKYLEKMIVGFPTSSEVGKASPYFKYGEKRGQFVRKYYKKWFESHPSYEMIR